MHLNVEHSLELVLLDINLGDSSGFLLCKELREKTNIPILFISARTSDDDKIIALNIGGDDYIQKPYSLGVLLAKVKVVLRRFGQNTDMIYTDGRLTVDFNTKQVLIEGNIVKLTSLEFRLLFYLQISNNLGKDCLLTRSGYERLGELQNTSYYLNLINSTNIDTFNTEITKKYKNQINITINIGTTLDGTASVYVSLMTIIVIAIPVLSAIVIAFVLYLLVRTMLNNKKQDYGILKALGFTTKQLILQTALSFMPTTILSTIVGIVICSFIINPLTALFLSSIGIVKCTFMIPIDFITIAGIGLILFSFSIVCLLPLRIKKITPRALLVD